MCRLVNKVEVMVDLMHIAPPSYIQGTPGPMRAQRGHKGQAHTRPPTRAGPTRVRPTRAEGAHKGPGGPQGPGSQGPGPQ